MRRICVSFYLEETNSYFWATEPLNTLQSPWASKSLQLFSSCPLECMCLTKAPATHLAHPAPVNVMSSKGQVRVPPAECGGPARSHRMCDEGEGRSLLSWRSLRCPPLPIPNAHRAVCPLWGGARTESVFQANSPILGPRPGHTTPGSAAAARVSPCRGCPLGGLAAWLCSAPSSELWSCPLPAATKLQCLLYLVRSRQVMTQTQIPLRCRLLRGAPGTVLGWVTGRQRLVCRDVSQGK